MGDKTNKILLMAAAGTLVAGVIPAIPPGPGSTDAELLA